VTDPDSPQRVMTMTDRERDNAKFAFACFVLGALAATAFLLVAGYVK
jgi:hypothetical protein